jgi:site-specific DNA recombinase
MSSLFTRGAVIVTRVSTGEQVKNGTSLESQLETCRAKAAAMNLPIVAEYEDAGLSGGMLLIREGLQAALRDIKEGRADTLICANISRYSRDVEHQQKIRKDVRLAGGNVVFCDMAFDDTPEGDLAFSIMGGFAEYERKVIRARTMRGKRKRAEEGQQPARSRSPYGYHIVTHADVIRGDYPAEMLGRYVLREDTAPIARWIFESYAAGTHSYSQLCKKLNRDGIAPPGSGSAWHDPTIRVLLTNPVYKGEPLSGRIRRNVDEGRLLQRHRLTGAPLRTVEVRYLAPETEWLTLIAPPLVSRETWDAVQNRIQRMRAMHRGSNKQLRMLSGMTYCPYCGGRAKIRYQKANGVRYTYFRCSAFDNARNKADGRPCQGDVYRLEVVEDALIKAVKGAVERPEAIAEAIALYRQKEPPVGKDARTELARLTRAVEQLRTEESAAVQAQIAGMRSGASPDAYAAVFADIAARRKDLENRRGELNRCLASAEADPEGRSDQAITQRALADALGVLTSGAVAGNRKHDAVMQIVDRVVCLKTGAEVYFIPGIFGENKTASDGREAILQTTCMVCRIEGGKVKWRRAAGVAVLDIA